VRIRYFPTPREEEQKYVNVRNSEIPSMNFHVTLPPPLINFNYKLAKCIDLSY